jgi:hypothetical protein
MVRSPAAPSPFLFSGLLFADSGSGRQRAVLQNLAIAVDDALTIFVTHSRARVGSDSG